MNILFHRRSIGKGIRSDADRQRAEAQVSFLRAALQKAGSRTRRNDGFAVKCQAMLEEREAEIREYDSLKNGKLYLPETLRVDELAALIPRIRIARGISQTELAKRLGVSKQVVNRYEESGYQSVGLARFQKILDALGTKIQVDLSNAS